MSALQPYFSIVVPTYNRPGQLADLLSALTQLHYPMDRFEVIVVEDGGYSVRESVVSEFRTKLHLTVVRQKNAGPGGARNSGAGLASGDYLAFTDDDCQPHSDWLQMLAGRLQESPDSLCGGRTVNALVENPYCEATQRLSDYLYEHYNPTERFGAFYPANNFVVPKEAFLELGGFDESLRFGEDRQFCCRWAAKGKTFTFASDAVVRHRHVMNLPSFVRLHFCYGQGSFHSWGLHRTGARERISLMPLSWYVNLVFTGVRKKGLSGLPETLLVALSQGAAAAGWFWQAFRKVSPLINKINR